MLKDKGIPIGNHEEPAIVGIVLRQHGCPRDTSGELVVVESANLEITATIRTSTGDLICEVISGDQIRQAMRGAY